MPGSLGRLGTCKSYNMDQVVAQALTLAASELRVLIDRGAGPATAIALWMVRSRRRASVSVSSRARV